MCVYILLNFLSSLCKIFPRFKKTEEISFDITSAAFKYQRNLFAFADVLAKVVYTVFHDVMDKIIYGLAGFTVFFPLFLAFGRGQTY